ncbi:concanavalin A-like lectin/glucanase domain-containing protein [Mycena rosella]|uniref:Glucanase n=1 Tax=Mycena rosella TaxID=1033263 RepID=A0AAD7GL76_MYCRO|nr:concanavalin A-like lectin/glucanase domain-containing protein [Mycena rosella]
MVKRPARYFHVSGTYGITTSGDALKLKFVTGAKIGSRAYLMADNTHYKLSSTFTVDVLNLSCGLNGALYFSEMNADGGLSRFFTKKAGAQYGTGYCDSQVDLKFINGAANVIDWTPDATDPNSDTGIFGTCCNEMDIWEGEIRPSRPLHPHTCTDGVCDKDGCDFNSRRMDNKNFLGPGFTVNTNSPFTVVTQFTTNGKVIQNSNTNLAPRPSTRSATSRRLWSDTNSFESRGGLATMGITLQKGMVLALSLWDDHEADILWLDNYPLNASATTPGVSRGPCSATSGDPNTVQSQQPNAFVVLSDINTGPIGSTFSATGGAGTTTTSSTASAPTGGSGSIREFAQCGGESWTGSATCDLNPCKYSFCFQSPESDVSSSVFFQGLTW